MSLIKALLFLVTLETAFGGELAQEIVEQRLQQYSSSRPGRKANLQRLFQEAGCRGERLAVQPVRGSLSPNVVCTLPGQTGSVIIVGAHYDKTLPGKGVVDNWTGASLLPTLFENLSARPRRHTFVFIGFTDEEKGLRGSRFYARQMSAEQTEKTRAMINLDTLGLNTTKVWESRADPGLAAALHRVARETNLPLEVMNVDQLGTSDSESFARRGIPSLTIHSVTLQTLPILHTACDNFAALRLDHYYESYRLINAYLEYLDSLED